MRGRARYLGIAAVLAAAVVLLVAGATPVLAATSQPGPPTGVTAVATDRGAVVSWTPPTSNGGSPITGYMITASPGGKTAKTTNVTSFTVGGLTNGTSYTFTVAAINSAGTGPKSAPSGSVTPHAPVAPSAPRAVTATAGYQSATVAWTPPASSGGAPINRYTVTANPGAITVTATGDARQAVLGGLANGTAYTISVTAANSAGTSPAAMAASTVIPAVTVPAQPATVQAAAGGGGAMTVRWDPPASDGGSPLTGYTVTTSPGGTAQAVSAGTTSLTVTGLTSGTAYTFSVAAVNAQGTGPARTSAPATPDATAAAATVVLSAASLSALTGVRTDGSLTFADAPPQVIGLASGDVIAAGITAATPQGLLRTVTSVTTTGSTTTVATTPAALDQALASGDLAMGGTLGSAQVTGFTAARAGVRLVRPAASSGVGASAEPIFSINADLYKATDGRTVHASGTVTITPAISLSVRLSGGHIYTTYRATLTQASSLKLKAQLTHDFSASIPFGKATFAPIVFNIGPVPVVIIPTLTLSLAADGTITVGALTSASETDTYGVQLAGTDGSITATPIKTHTTTYTPPTLYDSLSVRTGPEADVSLLLYGTVGPSVKDSLSLLKLDASTTANPWWTLSAENVVSAGFKLSALGHDISDWEKDPLFDTVVPLANAGGPFMGVVISPHPAAVSPGHTLQLSAVVQRSPIQTVTWSVAKAGGTITSSGLYTAPAIPGMYRVTATSPANGLKPLTQGILDIRVGAQPPGAPTSPTAASTSYGAATITWQPPANTGGGPVTGYTVTASPGSQTEQAAGTANSVTMDGLTPGATYTFTVTATSNGGTSVPSAATSPVVIDNVPGGGTWTAAEAPLPAGARSIASIDSVNCPSAGACAAAGQYVDSSGNQQGLLLTGWGTSWTAAEAPLPGGAAGVAGIQSVDCLSATACAAAGWYDDSSDGQQGLLLTGSGTSWTATEAPLPADAGANPQGYIRSVSCATATACIAAGQYVDARGDYQGLLLTRSGTSWTAVEAPVPADAAGEPQAQLFSVDCPSGGTCTAVGYYVDSSGHYQGLLLTGSGTAWTATEAPVPADAATHPDARLFSVDCASATTCAAEGDYVTSSGLGHPSLLVTGSGTSWTAATAPVAADAPANSYASIRSVSCASATACAAAGQYTDLSGVGQGQLITGSGTSWTATVPPVPVNAYSAGAIDSVDCPSATACVADGDYTDTSGGQQGVLLTGSGTSWTATEAPVPPNAAANPGVSMGSMSCASATVCAAGGTYRDSSGNPQGVLLTGPG